MDRKIERPGYRKFILPAAIVVAIIVAGGLTWLLPRQSTLRLDLEDIQISEVRRAPFEEYVPVRAEIAPLSSVHLGATVAGQITKIPVADGANVATGDILVEISNPELRADVTSRAAEITGRLGDTNGQLLEVQSNLLNRRRDVAESEFNLRRATRELSTKRTLADAGLIAPAALRTYTEEADYYRERTGALRAGLRQQEISAKAQIRDIQDSRRRLRDSLEAVEGGLAALVVRSPTSGRLTGFNPQLGQSLKVGDPIGQIDSEATYKLVAMVDEYYLGKVNIGVPATAMVDGLSYKLAVAKVLPQVREGRFQVELAFLGVAPPNLRRGQTVDVRVSFGGIRPTTVVDNGPWLETSGGTYAFVLDDGGRGAQRRPIQIRRRNPEKIEVVAGLQPGEKIVTSGYRTLANYKQLQFNRAAH